MKKEKIIININKIYSYGDSWCRGTELTPTGVDVEKRRHYTYWLSKSLNCPYEISAECGASFGKITHEVIKDLGKQKFNSKTLVLIIIPPDVRWYDQGGPDEEETFRDISSTDKDYIPLLGMYKGTYWFRWHWSLFLYTLHSMLNQKEIPFITMHNWGEMSEDLLPVYEDLIDWNKHLSRKSLIQLLNEKKPKDWEPTVGEGSFLIKKFIERTRKHFEYIKKGLDPIPHVGTVYPHQTDFIGKYFENMNSHPNELGHKKIAELLLNKLEKFDEKYK